MSSVETESTLSMIAEQAITAAASAIVSGGGLNATIGSPVVVSAGDVSGAADVAFLGRYGTEEAAIVVSEGLASTLAASRGATDVEAGAAWDLLAPLVELGARAAGERLGVLVDGLADLVSVDPMTDGLGAMAAGSACMVEVQFAGESVGWLMWIGSPALMAALSARDSSPAVIDAIDYPELGSGASQPGAGADISFLSDVTMGVTVELGQTVMRVREVLELTQGSVIELDRAAGALVDVLISGSVVARGEVVVIDDQLGVRVAEIVDSSNSSR